MKNTDTQKIQAMTEGGRRLGIILSKLIRSVSPGMSLLDIEMQAQQLIRNAQGTPSFMTVKGYSWATCLCVNDAVVHGIPTDYVLKQDDTLTIDIGMVYKGYHTDTAWTTYITADGGGSVPPETERFLKTGKETLYRAIEKARMGNRIGHISLAIEEGIEDAGYHIVRSLVGHGIGRTLHEAPQVPGILMKNIEKTEAIESGMTLAIEVIYTAGSASVKHKGNDGWTLYASDGSNAAVFEHTIAVTENGPQILTDGMKNER